MPMPASHLRRRTTTETGNLIPGSHAAATIQEMGGPVAQRKTADQPAKRPRPTAIQPEPIVLRPSARSAPPTEEMPEEDIHTVKTDDLANGIIELEMRPTHKRSQSEPRYQQQTMTTKARPPVEREYKRHAAQRQPEPPRRVSRLIWIIPGGVIFVILRSLMTPLMVPWWLLLLTLFVAIVLISALAAQWLRLQHSLLITTTVLASLFACASMVGLLRLIHFL
jgi:hypothetical protein